MIQTADDSTFSQLIRQTPGPILVDFWAAWCPPCLMLNPVLAQLAEEYAGQLTVVKVDVDKSPTTARDAQVLGMPTLQVYLDGTLRQSSTGARTKSALLRDLRDFLPIPA